MSFRYYLSGSPTTFISTKDQLINGFQANLTANFANASTYQTIKEEQIFGSGLLVDINCRVNRAVSSITGILLGDDFKNILFSDITHVSGVGYKYYFDENFWIVSFSETIKNLASSVTVRRCNNQLRWVNSSGSYMAEPCSIEPIVHRPVDSSGATNPVEIEGFVRLYAQLNDRTSSIKEGNRFLFGTSSNRHAFMVYGSGTRNWSNQKTLQDDSGSLLQLVLGANYVNEETDDVILGIADINKILYAISASPVSISGSPSMTYQIDSVVTRNLIPVEEFLTYTTSASAITIVSGSGLVTMISTGSAIITVSMTDNISIHTHIPVVVSSGSVANYEIRITPDTGYILEGETESYTAFLYLNGTIQSDTFIFSIANANVPVENYIFIVTGDNGFNLHNHYMYMNDSLLINAVSGSQSKQIDILLKGAW